MPNNEPVVITKPPTFFFRHKFLIFAAIAVFLLIFSLVLLNYFDIIRLTSKRQLIAQVNGEKLYQDQLEQAKGLFATLRSKDGNDPDVKKEALNFIIDSRLLEKEAKKRGIDVSTTVSSRSRGSISQYGSQKNLEESLHTSSATYQNYLSYQAIQEALIYSEVRWKLIDLFSIRYLFDDNAPPEEKKYKEIVDKKIQEYYTKIKNGLDIRQAIKERCKNQEINFLPYEPDNKIYTVSFNGTVCREQNIDLKISKDTNPLWGDEWLKQIFEKTKKGEISPIINFTSQNVGIYFIVKVLDEGGDVSSLDTLINNLRNSAVIKLYITI